MRLQNYLIIFLLLMLSACGFQLRGSYLDNLKHARILVNETAALEVAREVKNKLNQAEITLVNTSSDADYMVKLENEVFNKEVLTVSPTTGKVVEYELTYVVKMTIFSTKKSDSVQTATINTRRDYFFDEQAALGEFEEELIIHKDLVKEAAILILRRLEAATR